MAASVILMAANGFFTRKTFQCGNVKKLMVTGVSFRSKFRQKKRSPSVRISRYLFASHKVNMPDFT